MLYIVISDAIWQMYNLSLYKYELKYFINFINNCTYILCVIWRSIRYITASKKLKLVSTRNSSSSCYIIY